jgi:translation initiation factor 2 beta subunit (eIF-2beta)/eIF-5
MQGSKMTITISPAQALLILIEDALKKEKANTWSESPAPTTSPVGVDFFAQDRAFTPVNFDKKEDVNSSENTPQRDSDVLIKLFILGARNTKERKTIRELFHNPLLAEYTVSSCSHIINEDPVRRFFETHLAQASLCDGLRQVCISDLHKHFSVLISILGSFEPEFEDEQHLFDCVRKDIGVDFRALYRCIDQQEFSSDEAHQLKFSQEDWDKMMLLWFVWSYSYKASGFNEYLPIDIYDKGDFDGKNRSRRDRLPKKYDPMYSNNLGVFKSIMPTPAYSTMRTKHVTEGTVLSDYRTYTSGPWSKYNFSHLVHPFCNSISGTTLVQLRVFAAIKRDKQLAPHDPFVSLQEDNTPLKGKLADYFRIFSALLLYGCGGHSWFEFLAPITLRDVREEFSDIPGFEGLDMEYILFHNNEGAIIESIQESIHYNNHMLQRAKMHEQLKEILSFNNDIGLVIDVVKKGALEYNRWKRYNFIYTHGVEKVEMVKVYQFFDEIEACKDRKTIRLLLNQFFSSQTIDEKCKQSVHHYIQCKILGERSDDDDYSFLRGPGV